jgi:hypothetical protein
MTLLENLEVVEAEEYNFFLFVSGYQLIMGPAGFEPTTSSAQGWHPTKLDYDPFLMRNFLSNFNLISININHYLHYCYIVILWGVIISNSCL